MNIPPGPSCPSCTDPLRNLVQQLLERFLGPPAPSAAQLSVIIRQAARDAAREAVAEVLAKAGDRQPDPLPAPEPAPEPEPEPAATPQEALAAELTEAVERRRGGLQPASSPAVLERQAASELFVSECVEHAEGLHAWISSPDLLAAYEAWRPVIGAPPVAARDIGLAMGRAGYVKRQAHSGLDPRWRVGPKPILYLKARLRATAATHPAPEPTPEPEQPAAPRPVPRPEDEAEGRIPYSGPYPGRELASKEMREAVRQLLRQGNGWAYARSNGNGSGKPRLIGPDGHTYTLPSTPSDVRAMRNTMATLTRGRGGAAQHAGARA